MPETTNEHIPADSVNHSETGARKYVPDPAHSGNLQDGISRGGTITGDPSDSPPKDGYGLTEKVDLPFSPFHGEKVPEGRMRGGSTSDA